MDEIKWSLKIESFHNTNFVVTCGIISTHVATSGNKFDIMAILSLQWMVIQFFVDLAADNDGPAFPHSPNRRAGPLWSVNP